VKLSTFVNANKKTLIKQVFSVFLEIGHSEHLRQYRRVGAVSGQDFVAGFGYEDVVFDSDSELAGHVYAGLDCQNLK